jgi:hypothetical protein
MKEREFLNPADGGIYPESWYHRENIDLCCVIEAHQMPEGVAFEIKPENIPRMDFGDLQVITLIAEFTQHLVARSQEIEEDEPEEAEECASIAAFVSRVMLEKLSGIQIPRH